jgi:hypothetical protein
MIHLQNAQKPLRQHIAEQSGFFAIQPWSTHGKPTRSTKKIT